MNDLSGRNTMVVGASRGLGRGIALAFAQAGAWSPRPGWGRH
jgi:NAD(P)-dependent dehydrogenase (short-subunit alcohol dehydrogenase family)